jgi:hypothetical protein
MSLNNSAIRIFVRQVFQPVRTYTPLIYGSSTSSQKFMCRNQLNPVRIRFHFTPLKVASCGFVVTDVEDVQPLLGHHWQKTYIPYDHYVYALPAAHLSGGNYGNQPENDIQLHMLYRAWSMLSGILSSVGIATGYVLEDRGGEFESR